MIFQQLLATNSRGLIFDGVRLFSLAVVAAGTLVLANDGVAQTGLATPEQKTADRAQSLPVDPVSANSRILDLIDRLEKRRAREEAEQRAYIEETDNLIRSIREQIFEIELVSSEIKFITDHFDCAVAQSYEVRAQRKLADLRKWRNHIVTRCGAVDPNNIDARRFCDDQIADADHSISLSEDALTKVVATCGPVQRALEPAIPEDQTAVPDASRQHETDDTQSTTE